MRRIRAGAGFIECPNDDCRNATAEVFRNGKGKRSSWSCMTCKATGGFLRDDSPFVRERPAADPSS
jgi:hypothetical protein